jgi:hypothetical protein
MTLVHQESHPQSMSALTLDWQVWLKRQRDTLARGDEIKDVDVKSRV